MIWFQNNCCVSLKNKQTNKEPTPDLISKQLLCLIKKKKKERRKKNLAVNTFSSIAFSKIPANDVIDSNNYTKKGDKNYKAALKPHQVWIDGWYKWCIV